MAEERQEPRMARHISVERIGTYATLTIDGEPFPWLISNAVLVPVDQQGPPQVQVTLLAEKVFVTNALPPPRKSKAKPPAGTPKVPTSGG